MELDKAIQFLTTHHKGIVSTIRGDGSIHSSVIVCGTYKGVAAFVSVYPRSQKIANLRRNPTCSVLSVSENWRSYIVAEGQATLFDYSNTDPENFRIMLREVYRACSDTPHPDWEEFDAAMVNQGAVVVLVDPNRVYGQVR